MEYEKVELIRKDHNEKLIEQQSKVTFKGTHISYTNYVSYTIKQTDLLMDTPIYLGFAVLELSKCFMYETYYDELQQYFGREDLQLHLMNCDSFVLSIRTQNFFDDLKFLKIYLTLAISVENHEPFSFKILKVRGRFKIETTIWIDEFIALGSKMYAFECGDDSETKMKDICKT